MPEEIDHAHHAPVRLLAEQNLILEMIASGLPIESVLASIADFIDHHEPAGVCSIHLLDPDGSTLRLGAAPKLQTDLARALDLVSVGPNCAACGAAAYRRERVIVADIATDPLFAGYRDLALAHGLRSCWSTPIQSLADDLLGTVDIYYNKQHVPNKRAFAVVEKAIRLARIALEAQRPGGKGRPRSLIEHTSAIISILDVNGVIRYLSPSAERALGYRPGELVGSYALDHFHPDDLTRARRMFHRALLRRGPRPAVEHRFQHKSGAWRILESIADNQLSDPHIGGIIVTGHDITNRRAVEAELISSEERYQELVENATEIIYTHDLAGRLTSLNKAGLLLTGYCREEALGTDLGAFLAPEYRTVFREMMHRKIGGESKTTYEMELVNKEGDRIPVETNTRLIFQLGKPVGIQGIARDITERRRFETHALQSQKMEAIGRLAGGVAHDFNNLLTVITGYSQWMLDEAPKDSPLTESASEILLAANRAALLTNQLLTFSRSQVIQPIVVDLNSLVAELDHMLRRIIGEDVELVASMSPQLGLVRADPGQIEQVILNLAVNARDAMPSGGKLLIETANVYIGEEFTSSWTDCNPGDYVMLSVSDSGCGIAEEVKPHIFEPFFTTKETGKGTGLGLSTVYGIVRQAGGCIRLDSEPGAGAIFRIYLPKLDDAAAISATPNRRSRGRGSETILRVEDESAVRRITGAMLTRMGYTILEAPNGRVAQRIVGEYEKPIQLLLTDVVMPELGGRELAERLKASHAEIKVLFMSGYADAIAQLGMLEPGVAYLQKPFTQEALAGMVRELLDGE